MIGLGKHINKPVWVIGEKFGITLRGSPYNGYYLSSRLLDERCVIRLLLTISSVFSENPYWLLLGVERPVVNRVIIDVKNVNR